MVHSAKLRLHTDPGPGGLIPAPPGRLGPHSGPRASEIPNPGPNTRPRDPGALRPPTLRPTMRDLEGRAKTEGRSLACTTNTEPGLRLQ